MVRGLGLQLWDEESERLIESRLPSWGPQDDNLWGPGETVHGITRYEDCRQAISRTELESQIDNSNLQQSSSNLLFLDGDAHTRIRTIVSGAIPSWKSTAASSRRFTEHLLRGLPADAAIDLVNDFAVPIAENTACSVLGLGNDEPGRLAPVLAAITGLFDPGSDPSTLAMSRQAGTELLSRLRLIVRQKSYGCGSALDLLNQARLSGELSIREMLASSIMLAHASYQNSMNLLSFASLETISNPDARAAITQGSPAEQRSCVEELLRLGSPARFLIRRASEDLTIGSTAIGKGEIVILAIGMANRDPDVFPNPDEFDGSRRRTTHLAFGSGAHACLGAAHAKATTLAALRGLAGRYRTVAFESITWGSNLVMYGPVSLSVRLSE